MIDRDYFFDAIRPALFAGHMTDGQVEGMTAVLDAWEQRYAANDIRWLAYPLATVRHETAATMQPIREYGLGRGRAYGTPDAVTRQTYYGRGLVQLTWKSNYARLGDLLDLDLVGDPDLALVPANAAAILFQGMIGGLFTGVSLARYFGSGFDDPVNARRIINGQDCAEVIAGYHASFLAALTPAVAAAPAEITAEPS
jgi:putative chitinase